MKKRSLIFGFLFAVLASFILGIGKIPSTQTYAEGTISITFNANGGTCDTDSMQTNETGTLDNLPSATKDGYVFVYWVLGDTPVTTETVFSEDSTVTALYYLKTNTYTISKTDATYTVIGKTLNSSYNYTVSDSSTSLSLAIDEIKNDLLSPNKQTTINFEDISLEQNLELDIQNLIISGTINLNEFSVNYSIPTQNSSLELADINLESTSSQNLVNISGSNSLSLTISNASFNSSSSDNNYAIYIENSSNSIIIKNKISYQTRYFYNHDTGTSTTANNIDLSGQASGKLSISVPYYLDGSVIVTSDAIASSFEFAPLLDIYTCKIVSNGTYLQAKVEFSIKFDANDGVMNNELSLASTRFNISSPLYYPDGDELTKTHSTLNGFAGKLTLSAEMMEQLETNQSVWYFDQTSLNLLLSEGSGYSDIPSYFSQTIPNASGNGFAFYDFDKNYESLSFLAVVLMLDLNINPEFVALWSDTIYKISFETNGGSEISDLTGIYGSPITIPSVSNPTTTKSGYTFAGWYTSSDFVPESLVNETTLTTMPDTNPTLYAKWTANGHTLTIHPNNDLTNVTQIIPFESKLSSVTELSENYFSKTGHSFVGWYTSSTFESNTQITDLESYTMPNNDLDIFAKWQINQYTITLNTNHSKDNRDYKTLTLDYGADISSLKSDNPTFEGYNFGGWLKENRTPYTNTFPYLPDTMPAENLTLYAYWEQITYTIYYYLNETTLWERDELHFEDTISSTPTPIVSGYIFNGWYDKTLTQAFNLSSMPCRNVYLYAKMLEKQTISIDSSVQTYEISKNKGFTLNVNLKNFKIEYLVNNKWQSTAPTQKGEYDVRITRVEDAQYNSVNLLIEGGLKIVPNSINLDTYALILYCVAGVELLCAIIILLLRKQRQTYLNYAVVLPFGIVTTSGFINFIISLVLAIFGFVLIIIQLTKLKKVNLEIDRISTENKEYTPPDVSTNDTISSNVEILLKKEGFISSDEHDTETESNELDKEIDFPEDELNNINLEDSEENKNNN